MRLNEACTYDPPPPSHLCHCVAGAAATVGSSSSSNKVVVQVWGPQGCWQDVDGSLCQSQAEQRFGTHTCIFSAQAHAEFSGWSRACTEIDLLLFVLMPNCCPCFCCSLLPQQQPAAGTELEARRPEFIPNSSQSSSHSSCFRCKHTCRRSCRRQWQRCSSSTAGHTRTASAGRSTAQHAATAAGAAAAVCIWAS